MIPYAVELIFSYAPDSIISLPRIRLRSEGKG